MLNAYQPAIVGENGAELFQPSTSGKIFPNNALILPSMTPRSMISNISKTNAPEINFPVGDASLFNDPIFLAKMENTLLRVIDKIS